MMTVSNVKEVLWVAIHTIVTSHGSLQERLASAALGLISLSSKNGLPKQSEEALESIIWELTKEPAVGSEGKIQATTHKMSDQDAGQVAEKILALYTQLNGGI